MKIAFNKDLLFRKSIYEFSKNFLTRDNSTLLTPMPCTAYTVAANFLWQQWQFIE